MRRLWRALPFVLILFVLAPPLVRAQSDQVPSRESRSSVMTAGVLEGDVQIDGRLDEPSWSAAERMDEFVQFEPREGDPPTQPSEVRVLYGPSSLVVGATLFDEDSERIQRTLGRRDEYMQADWFAVSIDAHLDRRTAFLFAVNAAGVEYDAQQTEGARPAPGPGDGGDTSWDAIWDSAVRVTADGWVVEMEIP
ncbi:MAG: carbohydrate binding family 9 domain-containing protein, partial [Rhodothermales bacterium]